MVKYPDMRKELIFSVRALADSVYQRRVWINLEFPRAPYEDNFNMAIHTIFDDLCLDTHLDKAISTVLYNDAEAQAIQALVEKLNILLDSVGMGAADEKCINSPHWPDVLQASAQAYKLLTGGQKPEGMFEDLQRGWQPQSR